MKILFLDDDIKHIPHLCNCLSMLGHEVLQVYDWQMLTEKLEAFQPDGIIIDLMIAPLGLPIDKCLGGFTTGIYLYETIIHKIAPKVPFLIYTGSSLQISAISDAIENISKYDEFAGILSKGCDEESIIRTLEMKLNN